MATFTKNDDAEAPAGRDSLLQIFTEREQLIILHGFLTMQDSVPKIDYAKVAERMGLNPRTIGNAWGAIKKKISAFDKEDRKRKGLPEQDDDDKSDEDTPKAKSKPTPKRARTTKAVPGTPGTPTPKPKKTPGPGRGRKSAKTLLSAARAVTDDEEEEIIKKEEAAMKRELVAEEADDDAATVVAPDAAEI
ncbi:hypothetical protein N656DRAFT_768191 [Canariomyces notabilis]|uniref:Uncharacterized protein n=1 Tax=Canariomyces notabilis TaxID=2074819 RepID=A0AAN6TF24_9PEZI|nr:hypothetical protein N656DRAFT_768191 [Canariomyces arenarius]